MAEIIVEAINRGFPIPVATPADASNLPYSVASVAALSGLTAASLAIGTVRQPLGYTASGDVPMPPYRLEAKGTRVANGGAWVTSSDATKLWVAQYDGPVTMASFGVIPGGVDCASRIEACYRYVVTNKLTSVFWHPGSYHCSRPWVLAYLDNTYDFVPRHIYAYGVVVDNTCVWNDVSLSLAGLTVDGSPTHGFRPLRCQGGKYVNLTAKNCAGNGFHFEGSGTILYDPGTGATAIDTNYQVTRGEFANCYVLDCGGNAWHFTGGATANRSWCNAMHFNACGCLNIEGIGLKVIESLGPTGLISQFNYNVFTNLNIEGSATFPAYSVDIDKTTAVTFTGCHFANVDAAGVAVNITNSSMPAFLGGRLGGTIQRDAFSLSTGWLLINSGASGVGASYSEFLSGDNIVTELASINQLTVNSSITNLFGWSTLPSTAVAITAGGTGTHSLTLNVATLPTSKRLLVRLEVLGNRGSFTDTTYDDFCYANYFFFISRAASGLWFIQHLLQQQIDVTHVSLTNPGTGTFTLVFDSTANITAFSVGNYAYYMFGEKLP